ncbi:MAG: hypothetical protein IPK82_21195 [Polyangiaceae bacterium]|nr:hypothetical protein [Polyangiaceae bacterium]
MFKSAWVGLAAAALWGCSSGVGWLPENHGGGGQGGEEGSGTGVPSTSSGKGGSPEHTTSSSSSGQGGTTTGSTTGSTSSTGVTTSSGTTSTGTGNQGESCAGTVPQVPGCYWEPVCPNAPLADSDNSYSQNMWLSAALEATKRRYPSANCLFDMYASDVGNYADKWDFGSLCESMMTMMHEETHGYDYEHALGNNHFSYFITCDLTLETPWLDGFPRSEILPLVEGNSTNLYDGTYLTGTQGTYGFVELLDEWNAYLNGMAAIGIVGDYVPAFGISGTDGALALAYYVELYLRVARTSYPSTYSAIKNDTDFTNLLRLQWNRMHFFLEIADQYPKLSIQADNIRELVYAPDNQEELELLLGPLTADACN